MMQVEPLRAPGGYRRRGSLVVPEEKRLCAPPLGMGTFLLRTRGAPEFSPLDLSGLVFWLRGDDVTHSSNAVSSWNDKSGNGNHFTQGTAGNKPTYSASIASLNNQPGLTFDGSDDFLALTIAATWSTYSLFAAAVLPGSSGNACIFDSSTNNATTNTGLMLIGEGGSKIHRYAAPGNDAATAVHNSATVQTWCARCSANNDRKLYENDVQVASFTGTVAPVAIQGARIGRLFQDVYPWAGSMGEVFLYSPAISLADQTDVFAYLADRYGR